MRERLHLHQPLEAAEAQIDRAIQLFLDDKDYYCAITLAGAAEHPLAKIAKRLLTAKGYKHALDTDSSAIASIAVARGDLPGPHDEAKKLIRGELNSPRDWLKHKDEPMSFDAAREAADMIDRAVRNYWAATGSLTEQMVRFHRHQRNDFD